MGDYKSDKDFLEFSKNADNFAGVLAICNLLIKKGMITKEEYVNCIKELRSDPETETLFEDRQTIKLDKLMIKRKNTPLLEQIPGSVQNENVIKYSEAIRRYKHKSGVCYRVGGKIERIYNKRQNYILPVLFGVTIIGLFIYYVKTT